MSDHAFLAPSGASIWGPGGCAYYPTMAAKYAVDEDSPEAREGTAAHHYLSETLLGRPCNVGDLAENGHPITHEMVEYTQVMIDWAGSLDLDDLIVEERVDMPSIHPTLNWGTTDFAGVNYSRKKIYIGDYKHGHRYVDPWENWQEVNYGVGVIRHFGIDLTDEWEIIFAIVQPRAFHEDGPLKTWTCSATRFRELADQLRAAADEATGFEPAMSTGVHCRDCEGNVHCPAYQRVVGTGIDLSMRSVPMEMGPGAIGTMRTMIATAVKRLEGMASGLDAQIEALNRKGKVTPGWELKRKETRLTWTKPVAEIQALGEAFGVTLTAPAAITPTQAIKLGVDEAVILEYAERPVGGLKVAQSDTNAAAKAFK